MEKLEALEEWQSHIEGWEVCVLFSTSQLPVVVESYVGLLFNGGNHTWASSSSPWTIVRPESAFLITLTHA